MDALCQEGILTEEEAQAYQMQNDRLLKTVLLPAYEALADGLFVLEDTSIPLEGLASKPEGRAYYEYLLVSETGSYRSIEEIKELLSAKFSQEYEAIQRIVAQNPTLVQRLSSEEYAVFPYTEAEEMLLDLQRRMSGSFPQLPEDTSAMPAVTVKAVSQSLRNIVLLPFT